MNDSNNEEIARQVLTRLEDAWNAADGQAFGAPFTMDADFVAIRGDHHQGRPAIANGHQAIFETMYKGSRQEYELVRTRMLTGEVMLVLARGRLTAPAGPLAGESSSTATLVLVRQESNWLIASFHNTLVAPAR